MKTRYPLLLVHGFAMKDTFFISIIKNVILYLFEYK